eukprot:Clim_evm7s40 gene=Clim_evmTU7s40
MKSATNTSDVRAGSFGSIFAPYTDMFRGFLWRLLNPWLKIDNHSAIEAGPERYVLYCMDISYYSGKVQAYMRYKELSFVVSPLTLYEMADTILPNVGLMEVPIVHVKGDSPQSEAWLRDSTRIIEWLEDRESEKTLRVIPSLASYTGKKLTYEVNLFVMRFLEDFADEWMWMPAMYYRWQDWKTRNLYASIFFDRLANTGKNSFMDSLNKSYILKNAADRQYSEYVTANGICTEEQRKFMEDIYREVMRLMSKCFQRRPYLFGEAPSFADFGFMASMFRHFALDPYPQTVMLDEAPDVWEWQARLWNEKSSKVKARKGAESMSADGEGLWETGPMHLPTGIVEMFDLACHLWVPWMLANAECIERGEKLFNVTVKGTTFDNVRAQEQHVWSAERLHKYFRDLSPPAVEVIRALFEKNGSWNDFIGTRNCSSTVPDKDTLPLCQPLTITDGDKMHYLLKGTPRHRRAVSFAPRMAQPLKSADR